jgi:hypothetical protein
MICESEAGIGKISEILVIQKPDKGLITATLIGACDKKPLGYHETSCIFRH